MREIQGIIIRSFDESKDLRDVLTLKMSKEQEAHDFSSTTEHLLRETRRRSLLGSKLFVVCPLRQSGEKIVGLFLLEPLIPNDNTRCVLKGLVIDCSFQRYGIGTQLLQKLPALVMTEFPGAQFVHLTVHRENAVAIRLCEKCGFVKTGKEIPVGPTFRMDIEYVLDITSKQYFL